MILIGLHIVLTPKNLIAVNDSGMILYKRKNLFRKKEIFIRFEDVANITSFKGKIKIFGTKRKLVRFVADRESAVLRLREITEDYKRSIKHSPYTR